MTAVDRAELKRLAEGATAEAVTRIMAELEYREGRRIKTLGGIATADLRILVNEASKHIDALVSALRTQAPDSWRPTEQEVETVLRCCDAMERSVERKGLPKSEADICVATDWLRKVCAALRPQTAESGK